MSSTNSTTTHGGIYKNYFNHLGELSDTTMKTTLFIFITTFIISLIGIYGYQYKTISMTYMELFNDFMNHYYKLIITLLEDMNDINYSDLQEPIIAMMIAALLSLAFHLFILRAAKFQATLASAGLSQYYYFFSFNKTIYLKFTSASNNGYKTALSHRDDIAQMLGYENIQFKRWRKNGLIIQYSEPFPTIKQLSRLSINDFIKKEKLFLGVGIPLIGEKFKRKDLIYKRYLPRYIDFSDIPQGVANLGSAGGGKSNTMNQYLYSIFHNFNKIDAFYFVDFKGGIEAEPIKDLEERCDTGKIHIFDDDMTALYKTLKRLHFINKARMRYLRANKIKKLTSNFIVLLFDELAEILDTKPTTKEERFLSEKIRYYLESLLRTGRSQGFKIIYSTQSYLSTSSGVSAGMKNNTKLKIMHQLGSNMQVGSVKAVAELNDLGIYPTNYDVGRNVVINEVNNTIYEVRSLYIPDDFINSIHINNDDDSNNEEFKSIIRKYYQLLLNELSKNIKEDDAIYPLDELANDLKITTTKKGIQ